MIVVGRLRPDFLLWNELRGPVRRSLGGVGLGCRPSVSRREVEDDRGENREREPSADEQVVPVKVHAHQPFNYKTP